MVLEYMEGISLQIFNKLMFFFGICFWSIGVRFILLAKHYFPGIGDHFQRYTVLSIYCTSSDFEDHQNFRQ